MPSSSTRTGASTKQWERIALDELRSGDVVKGLGAYDVHDRIRISATMVAARTDMVERWLEARESGALMLAVNRRDVDSLNAVARAKLIEGGLLGAELLRTEDRSFALSDEVVCLRNARKLGVLNGTRGTVVGFDADGLHIETAGGPRVLPTRYVEAGHLAHGYATTVHKAQGATYDRAFVLATDSLTREAGYVAMSRARAGTELFVISGAFEDGRGPDLGKDEPMARTAARLATSRAKSMASEHLVGGLPADGHFPSDFPTDPGADSVTQSGDSGSDRAPLPDRLAGPVRRGRSTGAPRRRPGRPTRLRRRAASLRPRCPLHRHLPGALRHRGGRSPRAPALRDLPPPGLRRGGQADQKLRKGALARTCATVPWYRSQGDGSSRDRRHRRGTRAVRRRAKTPTPVPRSPLMPEGTPGGPWWGCYVGERTHYTTPPEGFLPVAPLYAGPESATLIIGPPRSGKTSTLVIPTVLDAPAAMVSTSTKTDVLINTATHRYQLGGRVFLFDPTGSVPLPWWVTRLRWSPVVGSADFDHAVAMAHALGSAARPGAALTESAHWVERAQALLAPLLFAAARAAPRHRRGLPLDPRPRPARAPGRHRRVGTRDGRSCPGRRGGHRRAGTLRHLLDRLGAALGLPHRRPCSRRPRTPTSTRSPSPARRTPSTSAPRPKSRTAWPPWWSPCSSRSAPPSCRGQQTPRRWSSPSTRWPTSPRCSSLPALAAEGGGQGLVTLACLQDLSQARVRWGEAAEGFFTLFGTKVILPGVADHRTLQLISALAGDHQVVVPSHTRPSPLQNFVSGGRAVSSTTTSLQWRPRLPVDVISRGRPGHALFMNGSSMREVRLLPWWQHAYYARMGGTPGGASWDEHCRLYSGEPPAV